MRKLLIFITILIIGNSNYMYSQTILKDWEMINSHADKITWIDEYYKAINKTYRENRLEEALEQTSKIIDLLPFEDYPYWHSKFVKMRMSITGKITDRGVFAKDTTHMIQLLNSNYHDSIVVLANSSLAYYFYKTKKYLKAIGYYNYAIDNYLDLNDYEMAIRNIQLKAISQKAINQFQEAIFSYLQADDLISKHFLNDLKKKELLKYRIYNGIALILKANRNFKESNEYYEKIYQFETLAPSYKSNVLYNHCSNCMYQYDFEKALELCESALLVKTISHDTRRLVINTLSRIHLEADNTDSASIYIAKFEELSGNESDDFHHTFLMRKAELELKKGNYQKGLELFSKEYEYHLANAPNKLNTIQSLLEKIMFCHVGLKNENQTLLYYNLLMSQVDTIYSIQRNNEIVVATQKYKTKEKEQENQLLKKEQENQQAVIQNQRTTLLATGFGLVSLGCIIFLVYNSLKKTQKEKKALEIKNKQAKTLSKKLTHHTNGQYDFMTHFIQQKKKNAHKEDANTALQETENCFNALIAVNRQLMKGNKNSLQDSLNEIIENMKFGANTIINKDLIINASIPSVITTPQNTLYLGLTMNELITNSLKYAFEKQASPTIDFEVKTLQNGQVSIYYQDNGIGNKVHKIKSGYGIELIGDMVEQMEGKYQIDTSNGFNFQATFQNFIKDE